MSKNTNSSNSSSPKPPSGNSTRVIKESATPPSLTIPSKTQPAPKK